MMSDEPPSEEQIMNPNPTGSELVGGPLDGQWRDMPPNDLAGNPPLTFEIKGLSEADPDDTDDGPLVPRVGVYQREVSPRNDGPLWLFRWTGWKAER